MLTPTAQRTLGVRFQVSPLGLKEGSRWEYMAYALAVRSLRESFSPENEQVNGPSHFSSEWLMDDGVIVDPLLGVRPWQAVDSLGYAIKKVWGDDALNLEKQIEEGTPSAEQIVWGPGPVYENGDHDHLLPRAQSPQDEVPLGSARAAAWIEGDPPQDSPGAEGVGRPIDRLS